MFVMVMRGAVTTATTGQPSAVTTAVTTTTTGPVSATRIIITASSTAPASAAQTSLGQMMMIMMTIMTSSGSRPAGGRARGPQSHAAVVRE